MEYAEMVKNCVLFSGLSRGAVGDLLRMAERHRRSKGEMIFSEGDDAQALFVLGSGAVDLIKVSSDGREQLVRRVAPGEMFAEAAMFAGEAYPVTAVVRKDSELISIQKDRFIAFVHAYPDASLAIMGVMARLLRHLNALLSDLSLGQVHNRLAAFLLAKSRERKKLEFSLGIPKQELAFRLGTIPATLSRNLRKLREEGVIVVRGDFVKIKKMKILEDIAGH